MLTPSSNKSRLEAFPPHSIGHIDDAGITILVVNPPENGSKRVSDYTYDVKYGCCGKLAPLKHRTIKGKIERKRKPCLQCSKLEIMPETKVARVSRQPLPADHNWHMMRLTYSG